MVLQRADCVPVFLALPPVPSRGLRGWSRGHVRTEDIASHSRLSAVYHGPLHMRTKPSKVPKEVPLAPPVTVPENLLHSNLGPWVHCYLLS